MENSERFLTLMRHGKAARPRADVEDFDRPLTKRGVTDSAAIAAAIAERAAPVDLLLVSSARRALLTGEIVGSVLSLPWGALRTEERFYMAEAEQLLYRVRELPPEVHHVMLVGHNPSMEELAGELAGESIDHLSTAGIVLFRLRAARWQECSRNRIALEEILTPKLLRRT